MTPTELGLLGTVVAIGSIYLGGHIKGRSSVNKNVCDEKHRGLEALMKAKDESDRRDFDEIKAKLNAINGRRINP